MGALEVLFYIFIVSAIFFVVILIGYFPGYNAKSRGHPNASAIMVCGFVGLVLWPAWFVALIWSFTGEDRGRKDDGAPVDYHLGTPRPTEVLEPGDESAFVAPSRRERVKTNPP
jgi:hypothetical protein